MSNLHKVYKIIVLKTKLIFNFLSLYAVRLDYNQTMEKVAADETSSG